MTITPATIAAGMLPPFVIAKANQTAEGLGTLHSLWKAAGLPGAGSNPPLFSAGSGYIPTRLTAGSYPFPNPVTGNTYLARLSLYGPTAGTYILYDRVWACSGFSTASTSLQSITTPGDVGRHTVFQGIEIFGEVYTAPGATGATWTALYTNQAGTSGRSAIYAHPANAESVGQMVPFTLQAGDTGVQSVQSLQCSVSSGTAGDIGLTLVRRLGENGIFTQAMPLDALGVGMPRVLDDACLAAMVLCSTTSTGLIMGSFGLSQVVP